jgi:hypothetical protein
MSSDNSEPKNEFHQVEEVDSHGPPNEKNWRQHSEVLVDPDLINEAVLGENREHEMGLWESVKAYPMACFWAAIMCFTIVGPAIYYSMSFYPPSWLHSKQVPISRIAEICQCFLRSSS